ALDTPWEPNRKLRGSAISRHRHTSASNPLRSHGTRLLLRVTPRLVILRTSQGDHTRCYHADERRCDDHKSEEWGQEDEYHTEPRNARREQARAHAVYQDTMGGSAHGLGSRPDQSAGQHASQEKPHTQAEP